MFCFRSSNNRLDNRFNSQIIIHGDYPINPLKYLPKLSEHIVQDEPECIIDDPSSIFFDPNEKPGFVYSAIPQQQQQFPCESQHYLKVTQHVNTRLTEKTIDNKILNKVITHHINPRRDSPLSSEFDDSLDRTQSLPNTPLRKTDNIFNEQFDNELEFDIIGGIGGTNYGHNNRFNSNGSQFESKYEETGYITKYDDTQNSLSLKNNPNLTTAPGLSEEEIKKLYDKSHESMTVDYNNLNLYEEELLQQQPNNQIYSHTNNKGYLSDGESVKTYQDSGIYDDDVFMESPKPLTSEEYAKVAHHLTFGNSESKLKVNNEEFETEKYSAFKTPMSSRQNSLESIDSVDCSFDITEVKRQNEKGHNINKNINRNEECINQTSKYLPAHHPQHPSHGKPSWKQSANKYSHIQAKVQSHRTRTERSPSPGLSMRKKSPPSPKQNANGKSTSKSKVDSLSNIKHVPGGGESKVFKEKLSFRSKAEARTDSHGIGMYAHLPEEFQEIARRLARQDSQLKKQETQRGRSASRTGNSSRQSSTSPTARGRSRSRRAKKLTPGNSISDIYAAVNSSKTQNESPSRQASQPSLSRSSSIRSIPSTPHLSRLHPSTSLRQFPTTSSFKSPSASPKLSPSKRDYQKPTLAASTKNESSIRDGDTSLELLSSPVSKLYQFTTQNDSFGSPQYPMNSIYQIAPVVR